MANDPLDIGYSPACPHGVGSCLPGLSGGRALGSTVWGAVATVARRAWPVEHGLQALFPLVPPRCLGGIARGCAHLPDLPSLLIDATVIRAHPCAAGAAESSAEAEALGRSRGGFGTQIHAITDALGNLLDFVLTGGQASDLGQADTLLGLTPAGAETFIGDTGYDSDALIQAIEARGMTAVIPPRRHRTEPRKVDGFLYKERHLSECSFNKIK
jgi:transposase